MFNKNSLKKTNIFFLGVILMWELPPLYARDNVSFPIDKTNKTRKSLEIGCGVSMVNWNRVSITGFESIQDNYLYSLKTHQLMAGVNFYVARELNAWFYLDAQGGVGMAKNTSYSVSADNKYDVLYMGGLGMQFRFTPLFKSQWVEPYFRIGVNYLYKNFAVPYSGGFTNDPTGEAHWRSSDTWNPKGCSLDRKSFVPLTLGAGVNAWLSDYLGLGLQGEYLLPTQKDLPRFVQMSARIICRFGGKSKHPAPLVQYVEIEKPIEKIIERVVERQVKHPSAVDTILCELPNNLHFEFDKDVLTAASQKDLFKLAKLLHGYPDSRFLITGYTDALGNDHYNMELSKRRAKAVYEYLLGQGVPPHMLKWQGVGKRASLVSGMEKESTREGDRKVVLERVTNMEYWNILDKNK